jgi:hypothetical protein
VPFFIVMILLLGPLLGADHGQHKPARCRQPYRAHRSGVAKESRVPVAGS